MREPTRADSIATAAFVFSKPKRIQPWAYQRVVLVAAAPTARSLTPSTLDFVFVLSFDAILNL